MSKNTVVIQIYHKNMNPLDLTSGKRKQIIGQLRFFLFKATIEQKWKFLVSYSL